MVKRFKTIVGNPRSVFRLLRSCSLLLLLLLTLSFLAPGQSARAAPPRTVWFNVEGLPAVVCAGQTYDLTATVYSGARRDDPHPRELSTILITHRVDASAIAVVTPPSRRTQLFYVPIAGDSTTSVGEGDDELPPLPARHFGAKFVLKALQEGSTSVVFVAHLPNTRQIGQRLDFEVRSCSYDVTIHYNVRQRSDLGYSDAGGLTPEPIRVDLDPLSEELSGTGNLMSVVRLGWNYPKLEKCDELPTAVNNTVQAGGKVENNQVQLKLKLVKAIYPITRICTLDALNRVPRTGSSTFWGKEPTLQLTVPLDGGAVHLDPPAGADPPLVGGFDITVVRVNTAR